MNSIRFSISWPNPWGWAILFLPTVAPLPASLAPTLKILTERLLSLHEGETIYAVHRFRHERAKGIVCVNAAA